MKNVGVSKKKDEAMSEMHYILESLRELERGNIREKK